MNLDLSAMLKDWPYEPGKINVRLIRGNDDEPLIQVRLDLGILQMRTEGRPDGQNHESYDSLLDFLEARKDGNAPASLQADSDEPAPEPPLDAPLSEVIDPPEEIEEPEGEGYPGSPDAFRLTSDECRALREEAVQYYHRYIAMLVLEDYEAVMRDTGRNLRVLDLCAEYGPTEEDRQALEQFRPYIVMMRSRALASQLLSDDEPRAALVAVDEGLRSLREVFANAGAEDAFEESSEYEMLKSMREALLPKLPVSQASELKQRLEEAIQRENYELAAILRDELRNVSDGGKPQA